jgi:hypothetical protein
MKDKATNVTVDFFDQVREDAASVDGAVRPMNRTAADAVAGAFFQNGCPTYDGTGPGGGGGGGGGGDS